MTSYATSSSVPREPRAGHIGMKPVAAALVTALSLMLLPVFYWFNRIDHIHHELGHQVSHVADEIGLQVQGRLRAVELVLRGIRGFVEGSATVTADEFEAFVHSLQLESTVGGLLSVAYIPAITASQLPRLESQAGPVFGVQNWQLRPAGPRELYAPVLFIEPTEQNKGVPGFDILTAPVLRETAMRARDTGQVSLSEKMTLALYGQNDQETAFAMYSPVYQTGKPTLTQAERQQYLMGWASARFRLADILQRHTALLHGGMHLQLFDGDSPGQANFLAGWLDSVPQRFQFDFPNGSDVRRTIDFGGQRWTYVLTPTPAYLDRLSERDHHWFAALGVLLSLAAGLIVWLLMTSRDRARRVALGMTKELRDLSSDMESTLNAVPDLLFEMDAAGRYLALRTRTHEGLALAREQLIGKSVHDVLPADAAAACLQALEQTQRDGVSFGTKIRIPLPSGVRWFELSIARKSVDDAAEPRFIMLSRDITDRIRDSELLEERERALMEAQRVASVGHFWVDTQARRWRGSPAVCELLGLPWAPHYPLESVYALIEPRHRDLFMRAVAPGSNTAVADALEFTIVRAGDGARRWMLMCGQRSEAANPAPDQLFFTLQDVTERRRSQDQLKLLEKAVASLNDMVVITEAEPVDVPGPRIVFVNNAFERKTGFRREEVLGRSPRMLQGPDTSRSERDRIRQALQAWQPVRAELVNYTKDRKTYWVELDIQPIADEQGWFTHWVSVERDVTERRTTQEQVHKLAFYDGLTQLPNRSQFMLKAAQELSGRRPGSYAGAAILIDLDNFKVINEHWGHRRGDILLVQTAERIQRELPATALLARLDGDEFIVLIGELQADPGQAQAMVESLCKRLLVTIDQPLLVEGSEHFVSASLGALVFGDKPLKVEELLSHLGSAVYSAKNSGRNTYRFFDSRLQAHLLERAALEAELGHSIERDELYLLYQPQVDDQANVVGVEALCRWRHPVRGAVSPAVFIPLAESNGFILQLGQWVLDTACTFLASWQGRPGMSACTLSVNVSARQFHHPDFVKQVAESLGRTGANPRQLKLELTESIFAEDIDEIVVKMRALRLLGVHFSLDDFGTGYSSLGYLKKLPLDQLKIDQSFVRDVQRDSNDEAIVRTIIALGHSLGLAVMAEGVETQEQRQWLVRNGCTHFQGYLFGRPMPGSEWLDQLGTGRPDGGH